MSQVKYPVFQAIQTRWREHGGRHESRGLSSRPRMSQAHKSLHMAQRLRPQPSTHLHPGLTLVREGEPITALVKEKMS